MKLWGVAPVLAAALLGGAHIAAAGHSIRHNHAQPTAMPTPSPSATVPPLGPPPAAQAPVLGQTGPGRWQATVLFTDTQPACHQQAVYWLETAPPNAATVTARPPRRTGKASSGASSGTGSSCQVTVTFTGLRGIPATAALVLDQGGTLSTIPLTVRRDLTPAWYLGYPAIAGGGMALALLALTLLWVRLYRNGHKVGPLHGDFWKRPILASAAWTLNDSWATNITAALALIGTVLATATAASSLFPGVALDRFALVTIAAGGIIVATPVLFGVLFALFTGKNRGPTADATIWLPPSADSPTASISVPSGARIVVPGTATVNWGDRPQTVQVQAGKTISVPPGGDIRVLPGAWLAIPGTTADIAVHPGGTLRIGRADGSPGELVIPDGDRLPPPRRLIGRRPVPEAITLPARITAPGGATITVTGTADVTLPRNAEITAPLRQSTKLGADRDLQVPQSGGVIAASLWMVVTAAVVTTFGIGAELGMAGTLAFGLSEASGGWRWIMLVSIGLVAVLMLVYAVTAISALANPEPGSSTTSGPRTSFTL